ncbi:MAG: anthranilate 1,2-dioxygenase [Gammaproteobacteria bacterium]|nr:anthranilate 1,2-dioxygenase [Gammaproteobacteria bacterium]
MIAAESRFLVNDLLADAVNLLDDDKLETWVDCFAENAVYRILSRENTERKLPLPLFQCENKNMIRDRVLSLRKANVTNLHRDRHVAGPAKLTSDSSDVITAESSYALYQSTYEGTSRLFSVGAYRDRIRIEEGRAVFVERTVIVDLFSVPTMLSTPI